MRRLLILKVACVLSILFIVQNSNAIELRYDGVNRDGEPLSSILYITDLVMLNDYSLFLEFELYGGLPTAASNGDVWINTTIIPFGRDKIDCFGIYTFPYLYIVASAVSDLSIIGTIGTTTSILELKIDGSYFVLQRNFTQIFLLGSTSQDQGNSWFETIPNQYVPFYFPE